MFEIHKEGEFEVGSNPRQESDAPHDGIKRQTSNLRFRWAWSEPSIWTDNMLTALENGVKGGKWFSLIDKVYSLKTLKVAWKKVKRNKGAAGIDGVSVKRFAVNEERYLLELMNELKEGSYWPMPVRRKHIPKGPGKTRPLGIPAVKDRIAQQAARMVLEPILENEFHPMSFGFRPNKSAKDALRTVDKLLKEGNTWVVDADLASYFDTIPHETLMRKLMKFVSDRKYLNLVEKWLKQEIMEEGKTWEAEKGSPQGAVLSPLLANLYLHDLDILMDSKGYKMIRYADDFVILTENENEAMDAYAIVQEWVRDNELTIHPEKTHVGDCSIEGQGFDFLGYRFESGKRWIRKKSIINFRHKIRELTKRSCGRSINEVIGKLNLMLKGWYNYFKHVSKWNLNTFDAFVRRRLRAILRRQNKRPGFGRSLRDHNEWPNSYFADQGLFSMEKARALEIACQSR